jgi:hypothetical protein
LVNLKIPINRPGKITPGTHEQVLEFSQPIDHQNSERRLMMRLTAEQQERINQYLNQVQRNLAPLSSIEQEEILDNLRAHIHSEIENRSLGSPTLEEVESVLNDMDQPESFSEGQLKPPAEVPINKRISRKAIIGMVLLPFGFFLLFLSFPVSASNAPTTASNWQIVLRFTLLPLSMLAPFASTALGFWGISEIRNSGGKVYGMPLAVFVSLFYPILVLDLILIILGWLVLGGIEGWDIIPLIWLAVVLVCDYFIIRFTWRATNRM